MKTVSSLTSKFAFRSLMTVEGEKDNLAEEKLCQALSKVHGLFVESPPRYDWVGKVRFKFEDIPQRGLTSLGLVRLNPKGMTEWTVVHELAHAWDASTGWKLSKQMAKYTHSYFPLRFLHQWFPENRLFWYHVGSPPAPCGVDKNFNALEDFAEAFTAFVFPDEAHRRAAKRGFSYEFDGFIHFHDTPRGKFIQQLITQKDPDGV